MGMATHEEITEAVTRFQAELDASAPRIAAAIGLSEHRVKWYVVVEGERIPHTASMRGTWAYDATCSCGWDSRTGGAVKSFVQTMVQEHKWDVANGYADLS